MSKNEFVSVEVIGKICTVLNCTSNDILEFSKVNIKESINK
ncbi:MAG: helix-turn-helix domain-containing protein [Clostridium saudiense]|nr:helix-turn-helix domain-containing protein [Clostridium saudiense]